MSSTTRDRVVAVAAGVALALLHLDFWRPQGLELIQGWLPVELAYRVTFVVLAWLYILFVCARLWRTDES